MSGLECSEYRFSNIDEQYRIDAEYYQKKYIDAYEKICQKKYLYMNELIDVLTDFHSNGSYKTIAANFKLLDKKDYAYMIRTIDLENDNYNNNVKYIDKKAYNFLAKSKLYGGEIVINKIGNPGKTYYVPKLNRKMSLGMNLFMIRAKKKFTTNEFLYCFLNTKIGKLIIERKINGAVPLSIDKHSIKTLPVPIVSNDIKVNITKLIQESQIIHDEFKKLYCQAEEFLLNVLGLKRFKPLTDNVSIKTFSESFGVTGRLDSEYYQTKFDELLSFVSKHSTKKMADIVSIKKSIEPGSDYYLEDGIPFIRVQNLTKFGLTDTEIFLNKTMFKDAIRPKKDTILLSKDGSVGIAYKIEKNTNIITSGAILHLHVKDDEVLPEYLTLVLNSIVVKLQAERDAGGSIIQHWKQKEIEEIIIPIIDKSKQIKISSLVKKSFELRKKSEQLRNLAIEVVDIAIKEHEDKALKYLKQNM